MNLYEDDKSERYTSAATDLDQRIALLIRPIFKQYLGAGYRAREVAQVVQSSIELLMLESLLLEHK